MPALNGFELLTRLDWQPPVVFTTAYDQYALRAFEVNSIDYLLKPVEQAQLERALGKLERLIGATGGAPPDFREAIAQLAEAMKSPRPGRPTRVASRSGERVRTGFARSKPFCGSDAWRLRLRLLFVRLKLAVNTT